MFSFLKNNLEQMWRNTEICQGMGCGSTGVCILPLIMFKVFHSLKMVPNVGDISGSCVFFKFIYGEQEGVQ